MNPGPVLGMVSRRISAFYPQPSMLCAKENALMPALPSSRGRLALIAGSLAGFVLLFVLGTVFSSGPRD